MVKRYSSNIVKRYSDNVITRYHFNMVKWYRFNVVKRYALVRESARKSQVRSRVVGNGTTIVLSHIYKRAKELHQAAASSWVLERRTEMAAT